MDDKYHFNEGELKKLMESVIDKYEKTSSNQYEIINYKLDSIESQTTRTNGRLTDVENKVKNIEIDNAKRYITCPQEGKIAELIKNSISANTVKKLVIRGIAVVGIFFAILFGLLRVLIEGGVIVR